MIGLCGICFRVNVHMRTGIYYPDHRICILNPIRFGAAGLDIVDSNFGGQR